jgi:hypothetical protein
MNKKILISEREKSHIGSLYNLINEKKEIESKPPFNATLVDIVVSDRANDPIADAKVKFFYNGKRILYDKTYRTDSNGIIQNIPVLVEKESIAIVLPYEKNKDKDILKDGKFSACKQNTEIEIEIIVDGEKYKNKHKICLNNGYELDGVYSRYDNVLDSNKLKIKVPIGIEEAQPFTLEWCVKLTNKHYQDMLNVDSSEVTVESLGGNGFISKRSDDVLTCYMKYRKQYPSDMQTTINRLTSTRTNLENFRLKWTLNQRRDIYKENRIMSVSNTIRKVVSEHIEKKQIISEEKKLINKRYKFSLVGINKNRRRIVESTLRDERRMLLRAGYNKTIVNETFLDVMNGLYGAEGNNVLKDIKTRLGQKIADQVKNKEDEHNMVLTAFEELPEEVIERAIKENRVDELSAMIATKAMEGYKTSFGTEGISGLMFASVDENKFKQEVAKLIEPAIKDITTKMDKKFKQVQDVVSGIGLNPTA